MRISHFAIFLVAFSFSVSARAQTVTFDFDTGLPVPAKGQSLPFDQTRGNISVQFGSPSGPAFSVQNDTSTGWKMSKFSGNYLYDNNQNRNLLDLKFNRLLTSITLTFATADFQQVEVPTTLQLTAYMDSTASAPVGSTTAHGIYASDTMPLGTLSFASPGQPFNQVEIAIPVQSRGAASFFIDNVTVTPGDSNTSGQSIGPNLNLTKAAGNQYEAAVAINPNNNNQIFVVSRNEVGGLYTARSNDGGVTWTRQLIARTNAPTDGDIPRAYGNASVAWDNFGNLFLAYLSQGSVNAATYVNLSLSKDAGATFYSPTGTGAVLTLPAAPPSPPVFGDQPTVTVGPGSAGFPGSVWVTYWTSGGIVVSGAGVSGTGIVGAFTTMQPPQQASVNFGDIAVGPNGEVMITYGPNFGGSGTIYTNIKQDGLGPGLFSNYSVVIPVNIGGFTPIPAQPNWGIDPEVGLAWDRSNGAYRGRIYLAYTNAPSVASSDTNIFVIHSDDMGVTWSAPVLVNDDTGTNSQFLPHIALDQSNGMIAVTWYDARSSALNNTARYYGAFSNDGGITFGQNFPIASGTSNEANSVAALKKTDYGDYTGSAFVNGRMVPAWADNSNSTGDNPDGATSFEVYTAIVQAPNLVTDQRPQILPGGIINASAFGAQAGLASGTWIEIYGTYLASGTRDWVVTDFNGIIAPTQLDNVQVTVNGRASAISHIGPGQVNAQVPDDIGIGPAKVVVTNRGMSSDPVIVQATAILPGLLAPPAFSTGGRQYVVAFASDGRTFVGLPGGFQGGRPAIPGEVITLYGIGFGPVTPSIPAGTTTSVLNNLQNLFGAKFDQTAVDLSAPYTYIGLAPGAVGLYQFNLTVPNVSDGDHQFIVRVGNVTLPQPLYLFTRH